MLDKGSNSWRGHDIGGAGPRSIGEHSPSPRPVTEGTSTMLIGLSEHPPDRASDAFDCSDTNTPLRTSQKSDGVARCTGLLDGHTAYRHAPPSRWQRSRAWRRIGCHARKGAKRAVDKAIWARLVARAHQTSKLGWARPGTPTWIEGSSVPGRRATSTKSTKDNRT
jgi:hypothetical protein